MTTQTEGVASGNEVGLMGAAMCGVATYARQPIAADRQVIDPNIDGA